MIDRLLNKETVQVGVEARDWEEAVRKSGLLLEEQGLTTPEYTEAMVEAVREYGPYMVVAPGVALAHARPENGVKTQGLSLAKLKTPVCFGHKDNDPVDLVFSLAATQSDDHVKLMAELADFLAKKMDDLKQASSREEVLLLLKTWAAH